MSQRSWDNSDTEADGGAVQILYRTHVTANEVLTNPPELSPRATQYLWTCMYTWLACVWSTVWCFLSSCTQAGGPDGRYPFRGGNVGAFRWGWGCFRSRGMNTTFSPLRYLPTTQLQITDSDGTKHIDQILFLLYYIFRFAFSEIFSMYTAASHGSQVTEESSARGKKARKAAKFAAHAATCCTKAGMRTYVPMPMCRKVYKVSVCTCTLHTNLRYSKLQWAL